MSVVDCYRITARASGGWTRGDRGPFAHAGHDVRRKLGNAGDDALRLVVERHVELPAVGAALLLEQTAEA